MEEEKPLEFMSRAEPSLAEASSNQRGKRQIFGSLKNLHAKNANNHSHKFNAHSSPPSWTETHEPKVVDSGELRGKGIMKFQTKTQQKQQAAAARAVFDKEKNNDKTGQHEGEGTMKSDLTYRYGNVVWSIACVQFPFKSHYRVSCILVA